MSDRRRLPSTWLQLRTAAPFLRPLLVRRLLLATAIGLVASTALAACRLTDRATASRPPSSPPISAAPVAPPASPSVAPGDRRSSSPSGSAAASPQAATRSTGTVVVQVRAFFESGTIPPPGTPLPRPTSPPIGAGVPVRVVEPAAATTIVAERVTDDRGEVRFQVPAGTYWVLVPMSDRIAGLSSSDARGAFLPDGQRVLAWQEARASAGGMTTVALIVVFPQS